MSMGWLQNRDPRSLAFEVAMAVLAVASLGPVWVPEWLPLQDLPQHLAAIRVLGDYSDTALNFTHYFRLTVFETQYLGYYGAVWALSWIFEVGVANRIFLSACLAATPYAMRYLLVQLDRPRYLTFFVFPLLYNTFVLLGFINFIAAIPLMLFGLGLAARLRDAYATKTALALAVVSIVCFFMHVLPFTFLAVGAGLLGLRKSVWATAKRWLVMMPAGLTSIAWMLLSPAGTSATSAVGDQGQFRPWSESLEQLPNWLINLTPSKLDDQVLMAYSVVALVTVIAGMALAVAYRSHDRGQEQRYTPAGLAVAVMVPLAVLGYFLLPISYDWIWPISPRFGLLAILLSIPVLPRVPKAAASVLCGVLVILSLVQFYHVGQQFRAFSQQEVGRLDDAIDKIPRGQRVAGLIFDKGSRYTRFVPFIHSVAYYQAQKGGAVMFTFADFPQSPFRFRDGNRPPRVRPRWEWTPQRVNPRDDLAWYNYVLVRGGPGRIQHQPDVFRQIFQSQRWSVWKRRGR